MKSQLRLIVLCSALAIPVAAFAQDRSSEEFLELSPFEVSTEPVASSLVVPNSAYQSAPVPISITRKADAVAVQIYLTNRDDRQETRNADLQKSIAAIAGKFAGSPGIRIEQREIRFVGGNRKFYSFDRAKESSVNLVIFASLDDPNTTYSRLKEIRSTLQKTSLQGKTTATDGVVALYIKSPGQYRKEILDKVFEDIEALKRRVGPEFEVKPTGLNRAVLVKVAGESEIEMWIDYSFEINSIRELTRPRKSE